MSTTALTLIENENAITYFNVQNGLDPIIEKIREEVKGVVLDISTKKGREDIASLAHRIAKTKTAIDKRGKDLVAGAKAQIKLVDAERSRTWDEIEKIQHEVRKPLTEWEEAEKARITENEADIAEIITAGKHTAENWQTLPLEAMRQPIIEIETHNPDWQEFSARAEQAKKESIELINASILKREKYDSEQAELARLRKEDAERKQREHEKKLQDEAAENARKVAEAEAKRKADAEAARVKAAQDKAEQERLRIEREKQAAIDLAEKLEKERIASEEKAKAAAKKAEDERIAAEEKAAQDLIDAENRRIAAEEKAKEDARIAAVKAEKDKQAAIQAERDRVEAEKKAEAAAQAKREADKAHRTKINNEALAVISGLTGEDVDEKQSSVRKIIEAIAKGEVPHVKINY